MNKLHWLCCTVLVAVCTYPILAQEYILEHLNPQINTADFDEIAPSVSPDGNTMYFTRVGYPEFDRTLLENGNDLQQLPDGQYFEQLSRIYNTIANETIADPISSGFNQDIWIAQSVHSEFDRIQHPSYPLNNALPNSISSLSHVPNEVIVINQFVQNGGMQKGFSRIQQMEDGRWSFPQAININNYHNSGPDVNMTMSSDGMVLLLALERGDAYGRSDLYVCFRTGDNSWSEPKNLGPYVNTVYRETTPFLSADMKTLYYASDRGNNTSGGSDIFVQTRTDDSWEKWTAPKKFRSPINSKANDSHPCFNEATGYLYFTSTRNGSSDIYRIQVEKPKPVGLDVKGIVINEQTGQQIGAVVISVPSNRSKEKSFQITEDGAFKLAIPFGEEYEIVAHKEGFESSPVKIKFDQNEGGAHYLRLHIKPMGMFSTTVTESPAIAKKVKMEIAETSPVLEIGTKLEIGSIYFEQSTSNILSSSLPELNRLAELLEKRADIYIRIAGHTDDQGEEESLLKLSRERAEAIKQYLVYKKFINPVRIKTTGYGAQFPVNDNSNDIFRRQNRRVEVEIIHAESSSLGYKKSESGE